MRVITCPPEVEVELYERVGNAVEIKTHQKKMTDFLQACFDGFDLFSKGHVNGQIYDKLCKILDAGPIDGQLWFEDEDFKKVEDAVKNASWLTPKINRAYLPFYEAVKTARTEVTAKEKQ